MNLLYVLVIPGLALIAFGIVAVFRVAQAPETEVSLLGLKMKTAAPGLVMIGIGAAILYPPVDRALKQVPTITDVRLETDVGQESVEYGATLCPVDVPLQGTISVGGTGGVISYRFVRTTGGPGARQEQGAVRQLSFSEPGTASVQDVVRVNIPEGVVDIVEFIEIVEPDTRRSNDVRITVTCDPNASPRPDTNPPDVEPPAP